MGHRYHTCDSSPNADTKNQELQALKKIRRTAS